MQSRLAHLERLLHTDPESARRLSFQVGAEIARLPAFARATRKEIDQRERERAQQLQRERQQASSQVTQIVRQASARITDPIERDFAFDGIRALQAEFAGRSVEAHQVAALTAEIDGRIEAIRATAVQKATDWKARKTAETGREAQRALVDLHRGAIDEEAETSDALRPMRDAFDAMRKRLDGAETISDTALAEEIATVMDKADTAVVDESCRRKTVEAIMASLNKAGFVVDAPQLFKDGRDEVVISARKPSGADAEFSVTIDGGMKYRFDHYEGQKCKADIDQVMPMLEKIYGIELSKERVIWENPDRLLKSVVSMPQSGSKEHGR
jgi:hypothetical protein